MTSLHVSLSEVHAATATPRTLASRIALLCTIVLAGALSVLAPAHAHDGGGQKHTDRIERMEYGVPHISTVLANMGEEVILYVREVFKSYPGHRFKGKGPRHFSDRVDDRDRSGPEPGAEVVLFLHGGSLPSVPDYDLEYENYSWAEYLAKAGYDVFMMDHTGYGLSPRPMMDEPCNANPSLQSLLVPNPLDVPCPPLFAMGLTSTQTDVDEVSTVVEFIRGLRGVDRVHLIGWSGGGPRIGVFAAQNPEKVDKMIFYATGTFVTTPGPWPLNVQTNEILFGERWDPQVGCENQFDPDIRPVIWRTSMEMDALGSTWGTPPYNPVAAPKGGIQRFPAVAFSFTPAQAQQIHAPSLSIVGEFDSVLPLSRNLHADLGASNKVLVEVACASHFLVWENRHEILLKASEEWLRNGSIRGITQGMITVDENERFHK